MTDHCRCAGPRTDRIRTINDAFRTSLSGGSVMVTRAVAALGAETQREIVTALRPTLVRRGAISVGGNVQIQYCTGRSGYDIDRGVGGPHDQRKFRVR
jgi:hypothetical protein